jgi:penicillin amidase
MKWFKFLLSLAITVALAYALNTKIGQAPPVGKFLDPFHGFWQNAEGKQVRLPENLALPGMKAPATIVYDQELIPHIFAENDDDLYFLQGYVTARHRLWQMEFQTHAAAGRIAELVGPQALDLDRNARRKGLVYAAHKAVEAMLSDQVSTNMLNAYSAGINAYIESLSPKDFPLEYKLLDYAPEPWSPFKSALLLKYMADMLSLGNNDFEFTNALRLFGREYFDLLYPDTHPEQDPVVNGTTTWDFEPLKPEAPAEPLAPGLVQGPNLEKPYPGIGSNNWAVSGKKTASGNPILAGDPHLGLNLPSIWFALQMQAPGVNVMGATLPGSPNVIIGFNDSVAWSVTNAERDVVDWFKVEFENDAKTHYLVDGQPQPVERVIEEIKQRGAPSFFDTVIYTHWGPVWYDDQFKPENQQKHFALKWVAHEPSLETRAFYLLNRANNYTDYRHALDYYSCPAQNFAFISHSGDIALVIQGKFPLKWKEQGKFVLDGSQSASDWQGYIPSRHNVFTLNPERGFVSSANQFPFDSTYPYYGIGSHYEYYRNRRINRLLASMENITWEDMVKMQDDNLNLAAEEALPYFLAQLDPSKFSEDEKKAFALLSGWDYFDHPDVEAPAYWEEWWRLIGPMVWDEMKDRGVPLIRPDKFTTLKLLMTMPELKFMDIVGTPEKETATDLIRLSFRKMVAKLSDRQKEGKSLQWADYKATSALHLARIEALSVMDIRNGGNRGVVNATSERHGPSWRMVVELTPQGPRASGIYPGGQSGNPGSYYFSNMVDRWAEGKPNPLWFMQNPQDRQQSPLVIQSVKP